MIITPADFIDRTTDEAIDYIDLATRDGDHFSASSASVWPQAAAAVDDSAASGTVEVSPRKTIKLRDREHQTTKAGVSFAKMATMKCKDIIPKINAAQKNPERSPQGPNHSLPSSSHLPPSSKTPLLPTPAPVRSLPPRPPLLPTPPIPPLGHEYVPRSKSSVSSQKKLMPLRPASLSFGEEKTEDQDTASSALVVFNPTRNAELPSLSGGDASTEWSKVTKKKRRSNPEVVSWNSGEDTDVTHQRRRSKEDVGFGSASQSPLRSPVPWNKPLTTTTNRFDDFEDSVDPFRDEDPPKDEEWSTVKKKKRPEPTSGVPTANAVVLKDDKIVKKACKRYSHLTPDRAKRFVTEIKIENGGDFQGCTMEEVLVKIGERCDGMEGKEEDDDDDDGEVDEVPSQSMDRGSSQNIDWASLGDDFFGQGPEEEDEWETVSKKKRKSGPDDSDGLAAFLNDDVRIVTAVRQVIPTLAAFDALRILDGIKRRNGGHLQGYTANSLLKVFKDLCFKISLCHFYMKMGECKFGDRCTYAHGTAELRGPGKPSKLTLQAEAAAVAAAAAASGSNSDMSADTQPRAVRSSGSKSGLNYGVGGGGSARQRGGDGGPSCIVCGVGDLRESDSAFGCGHYFHAHCLRRMGCQQCPFCPESTTRR